MSGQDAFDARPPSDIRRAVLFLRARTPALYVRARRGASGESGPARDPTPWNRRISTDRQSVIVDALLGFAVFAVVAIAVGSDVGDKGDPPLVRAGVRALWERDEGVEVVAESGDGREALADIDGYRSDVVLLDLRMPVMDGLSVLREPGRRADRSAAGHVDMAARSRVVVLTTFGEDDTVSAALRPGASGFLLKTSGRTSRGGGTHCRRRGSPCSPPESRGGGSSGSPTARWRPRPPPGSKR